MSVWSEKVTLAKPTLFQLNEPIRLLNDRVRIICLAEGSLSISCSDFSYNMRKKDLLLLTKSTRYLLRPSQKTHVLDIDIDPLFFYEESDYATSAPVCNSMTDPDLNYDGIRSAIIQLAVDYHMNPGDNSFLLKQDLYALMHQLELLQQNISMNRAANVPAESSTEKKKARFRQYLAEHYHEQLTLPDAAAYIGYTPQYLASFLKKHFNQTFLSCLENYRLKRCLPYLKYRSYPLAMVSSICGFPSRASFEKSFQEKYLTTPEHYRQSYQQDTIAGRQGVSVYQDAAFIRDFLNSHFPAHTEQTVSLSQHTTKSISCSAQNTQPLPPVWSGLINLGAAANLKRRDVIRQIRMIQKYAPFRAGRISDVIGVCMTEQIPGRDLQFDFSELFSILDSMLELGLKPFLDLGDKAATLHRADSSAYLGSPEEYDRLFPVFLPALLKACVLRYGKEELSSWHFELWMRYPMPPDPNGLEPASAFCSRFSFFLQTVKRIVPEAAAGGPGFNTFFPLSLMRDLLKEMKKQHLQPDFFSVYVFPFAEYETLQNTDLTRPSQLPADSAFFRKRLLECRHLLEESGYRDLPLSITEFSSHISYRNHLNDAMYQALFITRQILENKDLSACFGYWLLSDLLMEYNGSNEFLFGGNGLLTREGIPKPGFYAFAFLARLGDRLIAEGENHIITSSGPGEYNILLWHYVHFNRDFCRHPERYELQRYTDAVFENSMPQNIRICLQGVNAGEYQLNRFYLNAENGCILNEWGRLQYPADLTPDECRYLTGACSPSMSRSTVQTDGQIDLSEQLRRNEICLITLRKSFVS